MILGILKSFIDFCFKNNITIKSNYDYIPGLHGQIYTEKVLSSEFCFFTYL